jgi:hypothetical protein
MNSESAVHDQLQTYLVYGSILMLLILGASFFGLTTATSGGKKTRKPHLDPSSPSAKRHGNRRHKKSRK